MRGSGVDARETPMRVSRGRRPLIAGDGRADALRASRTVPRPVSARCGGPPIGLTPTSANSAPPLGSAPREKSIYQGELRSPFGAGDPTMIPDTHVPPT